MPLCHLIGTVRRDDSRVYLKYGNRNLKLLFTRRSGDTTDYSYYNISTGKGAELPCGPCQLQSRTQAPELMFKGRTELIRQVGFKGF